jgi:hypothetical protein
MSLNRPAIPQIQFSHSFQKALIKKSKQKPSSSTTKYKYHSFLPAPATASVTTGAWQPVYFHQQPYKQISVIYETDEVDEDEDEAAINTTDRQISHLPIASDDNHRIEYDDVVDDDDGDNYERRQDRHSWRVLATSLPRSYSSMFREKRELSRIQSSRQSRMSSSSSSSRPHFNRLGVSSSALGLHSESYPETSRVYTQARLGSSQVGSWSRRKQVPALKLTSHSTSSHYENRIYTPARLGSSSNRLSSAAKNNPTSLTMLPSNSSSSHTIQNRVYVPSLLSSVRIESATRKTPTSSSLALVPVRSSSQLLLENNNNKNNSFAQKKTRSLDNLTPVLVEQSPTPEYYYYYIATGPKPAIENRKPQLEVVKKQTSSNVCTIL